MEPAWTVKSKFIGDVAWFIDYTDALSFVESNPSIHADHYTVVEFHSEVNSWDR